MLFAIYFLFYSILCNYYLSTLYLFRRNTTLLACCRFVNKRQRLCLCSPCGFAWCGVVQNFKSLIKVFFYFSILKRMVFLKLEYLLNYLLYKVQLGLKWKKRLHILYFMSGWFDIFCNCKANFVSFWLSKCLKISKNEILNFVYFEGLPAEKYSLFRKTEYRALWIGVFAICLLSKRFAFANFVNWINIR